MHLCRLGGIPLALHWSFIALVAYLGWEGWSADGVSGMTWVLAYVLSVFTCVVLHELGHAFTARRYGVKVPRILLLPIGGMAEFDRIPRNPRHEILIALAGPAVNLALVIAFFAVGVRFPAGWDPMNFPLTVPEFARHLVAMNIVMGAFNLLPIFPMDGGRVLRATLAIKKPYLRATLIAASVAKLLAIIGFTVMLTAFENRLWQGAALFVFIFVAGEMEYRAARHHEREADRLRATVDRYYRDVGLLPPTSDIPRIGPERSI
jgi:Zn-dependent protease